MELRGQCTERGVAGHVSDGISDDEDRDGPWFHNMALENVVCPYLPSLGRRACIETDQAACQGSSSDLDQELWPGTVVLGSMTPEVPH